jgi:hypothetical protein
MIEGLKRAVARSSENTAWDVDGPIEAEPTEEFEPEVSEPIETPTVFEGTFQPANRDSDYYVNLVRASIAMGGRMGEQSIPVHWLSMTLAGLEGKHAGIQAMWESLRSEGQPLENDVQTQQNQSGPDEVFRPGWEASLELTPTPGNSG